MPPDPETPPDPDKDEKAPDKPELGDAGKKALDAERKAKRDAEKRAADAEARLKAIEDAEKSETDRLKEQVAGLEKERDAATADRDRLQVAVSKGLPEAEARRVTGAARRLHGTTVEELESDAEDYFADRPPAGENDPTKAPPGAPPREWLKPGNGDDADAPVEETDTKAIGERMFAT